MRPEQKRSDNMKKIALTFVCCASLVACGESGLTGDNPARFIGGSGVLGEIPTPPEDIDDEDDTGPAETDFVRTGGDVVSMSYDPDTDTLTIRGDPFDFAGVFARSPGDDVGEFAAFRSQTGADASERAYLAFLGVDNDIGISAAVVGTPYRLRTEFGGTLVARAEIPELPTNVQMTHRGDYAAVRTLGTSQHRIVGRSELYLDFFDDRDPSIEGVIRDRRNLDTDEDLPVITLVITEIDGRGNFSGDAVDEARPNERGEYDGMIAGDGALASAGVVVISYDETPLLDGPEHVERGAFIARSP